MWGLVSRLHKHRLITDEKAIRDNVLTSKLQIVVFSVSKYEKGLHFVL